MAGGIAAALQISSVHAQADSGKAKIEDTATQLWSSSSKWLRSAGKKLASAAKESATQLQTKLETIDPRFAQKGMFEPQNVGAARVGAAGSKESSAGSHVISCKTELHQHARSCADCSGVIGPCYLRQGAS